MISERDILDLMDLETVTNYVLNEVPYDELLELIGMDYVKKFYETENESLNALEHIEAACRIIQPRGYIGKEEAKKIICEHIDNEMISRVYE